MKITYQNKIPWGYLDGFRQNILMTKEEDANEMPVINIYPEITGQTFEGFGGSVTEGVGYIYSLMDEETKKKLIHQFFSPEEMNYRVVRVNMDSCDACTGMYEAVSDPEDAELKSFSFERTEKYIIPFLEAAKKERGGDLSVMLSPWSPPAFMKTNGNRKFGGHLKPEYYGMWAKILCRYMKEFRARGFYVQRVSIQNEANAVQIWDSCVYTAQEEKVFLRDHLVPEMRKEGLDDIEVFIWDHNKERLFERVRDTVDETTKDMITGVAYHWYGGDHFGAIDLVRRFYPDLKMISSENGLEFRVNSPEKVEQAAFRAAHEIVGNMNLGMSAFYEWAVVLDSKGGPNHVANYCSASFLYDPESGELAPQSMQKCYWLLSHYIVSGSVWIASSSFSDEVEIAAFRRPDGTIAAIAVNRSSEAQPVTIRMQGEGGSLILPARSIGVMVISE